MKKSTKIVSLMLSAVCCFGFFGCGEKDGNKDDGGLKLITTGGREVLFEYLDAGFGDNPYIAVANAFMEKHSDVQIKLVPNRELASTTALNIKGDPSGVSDIYSYMSDGQIKTWVTDGLVEDLTELVNKNTEDGKTVLSAMTGNAASAVRVNDKVYAIPEYTRTTGFVYNVEVFEKYGWKVPSTTKELKELCDAIIKDSNGKISPIVWCNDADGYLYYATENWLSQYEGVSRMDKFYEYNSVEVYATEDNDEGSISTAKSYALENLVKFFLPISEGGYAQNDSRTISNVKAQYAVINGTAAMMLNGSWFENEMKLYIKDQKLGMFPVPELSDEAGNVLRSDGFTTESDKRVLSADYGSYYFIPTKANNKSDAMDFLLYLSSKEACTIYTQYSNAVRPFDYDLDSSSESYKNMSEFGKSVLDMGKNYYLYSAVSNSTLALKNKGGLWPRGVRIELEILAKGANTSPAYWLEKDYNSAKQAWNGWMELV